MNQMMMMKTMNNYRFFYNFTFFVKNINFIFIINSNDGIIHDRKVRQMEGRRNTKMGILVAILVLAIGFATVTTTLYINGIIKVAPDREGFEKGVIFESATVASNTLSGTDFAGVANLSTDKKTIEFTTGTLKSIGEKVTLTYKIANNSTYNAKINALTCKVYDDEQKTTETNDTYLTVVPQNEMQNEILGPKAVSGDSTVEVTMVKSFAGTETSNTKNYYISCTIQADTTETAATITSTTTA